MSNDRWVGMDAMSHSCPCPGRLHACAAVLFAMLSQPVSVRAAATVVVGPTPIVDGEATSARDITVVNEHLALGLAVESVVPYGVPRGAIVVRRTSANERVPVPLARVRGEVSTEQRTDRGEGLSLVRLSLSKADICPISRCLQVRLEAQTPENADRFDTTWRRACVGYSIYPW